MRLPTDSIGLYGGSFNPVHIGHLFIIEHVEKYFSELIVIPAYQNPWKSREETLPDEIRLSMLRLATQRFDSVKISEVEISEPKPSYTFQTISYFSKKYPKNPLYFIVGADSFENISKWDEIDEIISKSNILVFGRTGIKNPNEFNSERPDILARTIFLDLVPPDASSTFIRANPSAKETLQLIPNECIPLWLGFQKQKNNQ